MKFYYRNTITGIWHWRVECPDKPQGRNIETTLKRPRKGVLCKLCSNIEIAHRRIQIRHEMSEEDVIF